MLYRAIDTAAFLAELSSTQDPWWAYAYTSMFASIRQQRWDSVTGDVRDLAGRAPAALHELLGRPLRG